MTNPLDPSVLLLPGLASDQSLSMMRYARESISALGTLEGVNRPFSLEKPAQVLALRTDHARMPELLLRPGEYAAMADRLRGRFGDQAFEFADETRLVAAEQKMLADSLRTVPLNED